MTTITEDFGKGGANLMHGHGDPSLRETLQEVADDIGELAGGLSDWSAALTVTAHVVELPRAGVPVAVEATAGTSTGVKQMQYSGSPAAGFVNVAFADGVATLTFEATDAVTECRVLLSPAPATVRTLRG